MNLRPWKESEKLIKDLYEMVQNLQTELDRLRKEFDKVVLITEIKNELVNRIITDLKPVLSKELSESIAESIQKKLSSSKQGLV
jgi:hypothetical protein